MKNRTFIFILVLSSFFLLFTSGGSHAWQKAEAPATCPNCGMVLKDWAHTNHEFVNEEGQFRTCSIHCLSDMRLKSGLEPQKARVALHLQPDRMVAAEQAVYVIGSKDPGTMTAVSKLAFESRSEAEKFMAEKGGKIGTFSEMFTAATQELPQAKTVIEKNRKNKGKIVDPAEEDRCVVCNMMPSKYPKQCAQLLTSEKKRIHSCSTQCLFSFLQDKGGKGVGDIWVHDYPSGRYLFARNAYYVVGSRVLGPMGPEALAFDLKAEALSFSKENGGQVLRFNEVTRDKVMAR